MIEQYKPIFNIAGLNTDFVSYFQSGGYMTEYKKTEEFENKIKEFLGVKYCSVVNNGTISLSLALLACGVKAGDEVLVPNLTMVATANAVSLIGATPIFVDISPYTFCMDLVDAERKINSKTKAFIYVTLNGRSANKDLLNTFAKNCKLSYISDDAQSFGSCYSDGSKIGTGADISSFSFSMPKIITTGQGGCLVTNNEELGNKIKKLKDFGRVKGGIDTHDEFGINSKFTELQSILGLSQIKDIDMRIKQKKLIYNTYYENLKDLHIMMYPHDYITPWFVDIYLTVYERKVGLIKYLLENNIKTREIYSPINYQKCYKNHKQSKEVMFNSIVKSNKGLWLPSSLDLSINDIQNICNKIKEFLK